MEEISSRCGRLPRSQRSTIRVARFSVSTPDARGVFGGELATMLSNALQQTRCFRVLETLSNQEDMTEEIAFGQGGLTAQGASPQGGRMLGAQIVVTGEVTEFNEGADNISALGFSAGNNKARVGFIMKVVDPQTGEILFSESINVIGKTGGVSGLKFAGISVAGTSKQNQALNNAVEQAILEAASLLVDEREYLAPATPNAGAAREDFTVNCAAARRADAPSVMVIIPEWHIQRAIPDPAGETEIIRQFIKAGYAVIDPSVYDALRGTPELERAAKDAQAARRIGDQFGADIIVIGEAFSERAASQGSGGLTSCRARVEARAVRTSDARILAADGLHASGAEVTESGSAKLALRNAGGLVAQAFLAQLCQ